MSLSAAGSAPRVLVFDEDSGVLELETEILEFAGYDVTAGRTADQTVEIAADGRFDLVVIDLGRRGRNEFLLLDRLVAVAVGLPVIVLSGFDASSAIQAVRRGAYGFLTKPIDVDRFLETVRAAIHSSKSERSHLDDTVPFLGTSRAVNTVYGRIEEAAHCAANVLILGEPGTGKEAVARSIYRKSCRSEEPFLRFLCSGRSGTHLAEDLFGLNPGALPENQAMGDGVLERAGKGTVLVRDPDMLPVAVQYSLLEAIQKGMITRLRGGVSVPLRARIISTVRARHGEPANLEPLRDDLCYLLGHIVISIPPLRDRPEDIPLIVAHTLRFMSGNEAPAFSEGLAETLSSHPWPGNLNQITSMVRRVLSSGDAPLEESLKQAVAGEPTRQTMRLGLASLQGNPDQNPSHDSEDNQ